MLGSQASSIAVFLYLFRTGNSVLDLATIAALRTLPAGLIAPLAGVVVDRARKRAVMIAADLSCMGLLAGLIFYPHVLFLYAATALCSLADAFFEPRAFLHPSRLIVNKNDIFRSRTDSTR